MKIATNFGTKGMKDMKKRDVTKDEINKITEKCPLREQAFFTIMRQSGLPPHTIKQLKIRNVEKILESNTPIPCEISILHERLPTFIGKEAVKYIKQYLATRTNLAPRSLLFAIKNNPNKEINTKDVSRAFRHAAQRLKKTNKITYEIRRGKPSELRLYNLKRFYEKNAKQYLTKLGDSNTPKDDEFYRKLYEEIAMPLLEIETPTTIEIHQLETQNRELTQRLTEIENKFLPEPEIEPPPEYWKETEKQVKELEKYEKWLKEHPEEEKRFQEEQEEQQKEHERWLDEHQKEAKQIEEQDERAYTAHLEDRVEELENRLRELENIVKRPKRNRVRSAR